MPNTISLQSDEQGAVFVEKLIVYLPLMLTFFLAWELAELAAASLVVQRASSAAGRAAIVVLPDDPIYYGGEDVGNYSGQRKDDIELAAGMILSSHPRFSDDFTVDVGDPPDSVGPLDVTVTANYSCGKVSLFCGSDASIELSATTTHTYQAAKYVYTMPEGGGGLGGTTAGLVDADGNYHAGSRDGGDAWRAGIRSCGDGKGSGAYTYPPAYGSRQGSYGSGLSQEALRYRCDNNYWGKSNVGVLYYSCGGKQCVIPAKSEWNGPHSERQLIAAFDTIKAMKPSCKIDKIYTEREPCDDGSKCTKGLNTAGIDRGDVVYNFTYNPKSIDVDTDDHYARQRQACDKIKLQVSQWRKQQARNGCTPPAKNSCEAIEGWAKDNGKQGSSDAQLCMELNQAREDFEGNAARTKFEQDTAAKIQAAKSQCSSLPASNLGQGDECAARSKADIDAEIAKIQKKIDRIKGAPGNGAIPLKPDAAAKRIAEYEADIRRLQAEKASLP